MSARTLKESYTSKKAIEIKKKAKLIHEQKLQENALLLENAKQITSLIKALRSIDFANNGYKSLAAARDAAVNDLDQSLGNSKSIRGKMRNLGKMIKSIGRDSPVGATLAMSDGIYNFFDGLNDYITSKATGTNAGTDDEGNKVDLDNLTILEVLTGDLEDQKEIETRIKGLHKFVKDSFKSEGKLSVFNKSWMKTYFKNNFDVLVKEVTNSTMGNLNTVMQAVASNLKNAKELGSEALGGGGGTMGSESPTGPAQTKSSQPSGASAGSEGTEDDTSGMTDKNERAAAVKKADEIYPKIVNAIKDIDQDVARKVIASLAFNDMLK
jgi:ribonucleotide reductase beta subunit family protein with ferritin-like domain